MKIQSSSRAPIEKPHKSFKNLISILLCDHITRIKDLQTFTAVQHDSFKHKDSTSITVIDFLYVGGMVAALKFFSDGDLSIITLCTESQIISKDDMVPILLCPEMAILSSQKSGSFL
ncbi:hypothetical protein AVEN_184401-1 [Araneus ventricosus]|uniref:Uncharacterized protein n=1 Tax=Araneus ventricosus TaxID=182803 RepID=A0A4Y2BHH5_ARAVE|nr:hypothetical protein AVEN_184401-1 [Araneus ventricosus]